METLFRLVCGFAELVFQNGKSQWKITLILSQHTRTTLLSLVWGKGDYKIEVPRNIKMLLSYQFVVVTFYIFISVIFLVYHFIVHVPYDCTRGLKGKKVRVILNPRYFPRGVLRHDATSLINFSRVQKTIELFKD